VGGVTGKSVGLVTTSQVTDASPAGFATQPVWTDSCAEFLLQDGGRSSGYSSPRSLSRYCCIASSMRCPVTRKTVLPPTSTPWSEIRSK
jgi:hypothetical protein